MWGRSRHALCYNADPHDNALLRVVRSVTDKELVFETAVLPQQGCLNHTRDIMNHAVGRRVFHSRGRIDESGTSFSPGKGDNIAYSVRIGKQMPNSLLCCRFRFGEFKVVGLAILVGIH